MLKLKMTVIICSLAFLVGCQTTDNHIWVTDLSARAITPSEFTLRKNVRIGEVENLAKNAPNNITQAVVTSFRKNDFIASSPSKARYVLNVKILEYAELKSQRTEKINEMASQLDVNDDTVIILNSYTLQVASSGEVVREINILTTYDRVSTASGVLVSCDQCTQADASYEHINQSRMARSDKAKALENWKATHHGETTSAQVVVESKESDPPSSAPSSTPSFVPRTREAALVGAIAAIIIVGIISGGRVQFVPAYGPLVSTSGGLASMHGVGKYRSSISRARAFQNNMVVAIDILSKEKF